ncbi:Octopine transport system permease protein OccM [Sodalis praecaptivus]
MDFEFLRDTLMQLLPGVPLTLELAIGSVALGFFLALLLALMRLSGVWILDTIARLYVFAFRGSPLLVQMFLIYYGLGHFPAVRESVLWPILREPYWCALLSLTLCTAAYASEIIRGGLLSVPGDALKPPMPAV